MTARLDLTGQTFGKLTVVAYVGSNVHGKALWRCVCSCDTAVIVPTGDLRNGKIKSCGCMRAGHLRTHGMSASGAYSSWNAMKKRCFTRTNPHWKNYGGRGITVCDRWLTFENFYADMGDRPEGMSIDRIDVDGNYEPSNCKWSTHSEQIRNRRKKVN